MPTDRPIQPIEVVTVTPVDLLAAYGIGLAVILAAVFFALWVFRSPRPAAEADSPESVETAELPRERQRPHVGTIWGPIDYQPADDATVINLYACKVPGR